MSKKNGQITAQRKNFSQVSNAPLRDKTLSLKAKGLYSIIESYINIPNFTLYKNTLKKDCLEGDTAFESAWKELKKSGYLTQTRKRDEEAKTFYYEYELLYELDNESHPPKTYPPANRGTGKEGSYSNTDINNTNLNNTYFTQDAVSEDNFTFGNDIDSRIQLFKIQFYKRFSKPYRKTKRTSFNNESINSIDIDDLDVFVNQFFDLMDNDPNKCTIEYMDKVFDRLQ